MPSEDPKKTPESVDPAIAINAGLWEAIEELKSAKFGLEAKLRMAESRAKDLEKTLERTAAEAALERTAAEAAEDAGSPAASIGPTVETCNSALEARDSAATSTSASPAAQAPARAWSTPPPPPPREEVATATALAVAEKSEREAFEAERQALLEKMEELRAQAQAAAASAEAAAEVQRKAASAAAEDAAAAAVAAAEAEEATKKVAEENEALRKERSSLKDQLEVFERLMDAEAHEASGVEHGDDGKTSFGDKVKNFHSQLALEAVGLRKEIAGLKKKKWVLKSVLATGGESERRAIEAEVAELRRKTSRVEQTGGDTAESVKPG